MRIRSQSEVEIDYKHGDAPPAFVHVQKLQELSPKIEKAVENRGL